MFVSRPPLWRAERADLSRLTALIRLVIRFHDAGLKTSTMASVEHHNAESSERGFIIDVVSDEVGRGIFATKDFQPGETVFKETPIVSAQFCWNEEYGYRSKEEIKALIK